MNAHVDAPPIIFEVVPFDRFVLEEDLFQTHAEYVGKSWDDVLALNWPLAGSMAARNELYFICARSGPRMVGYAVIMLGADLQSTRVVASLVFLFAKDEFPFLGVQLARRAAEAAKVLGCAALWLFRTKDSPQSDRLNILAKRLRAHEVATTYELPL